MVSIQGVIQVRRDSTANWLSANPVLASGEPGYDTTARRFKMGDGATTWKSLGWATDIIFTPPPSTGWTALNSGSVTDNTESRGFTLASSAGDNWKGELRTLTPASNYTATFYFDWSLPGINYSSGAIILKNSGGAPIITYGATCDTAVGGFQLRSTKWNSVSSFNANYLSSAITLFPQGIPNWIRVRDDATTRFYEYSVNGVDWNLHTSSTRTDFLTANQIGWGGGANNAGGSFTTNVRLSHLSGVS